MRIMQWNFRNKAKISFFVTVFIVGNTINYLVHALVILDYFIFLIYFQWRVHSYRPFMVYIIFCDVRVLMNTNQHYIKRMQSQAPFLLDWGNVFLFFSFFTALGNCFSTGRNLKMQTQENKKYNRDTIIK